ncbi:MAG: four helix bundle protein [Patescibacteria group bacterium]
MGQYDLEDRTFLFAQDVRRFVKLLPSHTSNYEDVRQLVRSSGSVGANYIEANEAFSKKDFAMRIKICRKEAKETRYWLMLLDVGQKPELDNQREKLVQEVTELMKIFGAILNKV